MEGRLYHLSVLPPEFPLAGQDALSDVFGQVPGLQFGLGIVAVVLLQYVPDDDGVPGEDYPGSGRNLYFEGVPVLLKFFVMKGQGVFQDTPAVPSHRPGGHLMDASFFGSAGVTGILVPGIWAIRAGGHILVGV